MTPLLAVRCTADNGVAGVVIGGCAPTNLHPYYYLESPTINTAIGSVHPCSRTNRPRG